MIKYLTMTIEKQKNIALIAHDGKKQDMLKWCMDNKEILQQHNLSGTGTTARMIADHVGLKIKGNTLHNGITGMCSYNFVLSGSARLFLCWVCEYSPNSSIYGYGKDCSETICAIAKCIKNRY